MTERAFFPMRITGTGLCSAHDADTLEALRAIAAGVSKRKRHPVFVGADGMKQLCAPVPSCETERDTVARTGHLATQAHASLQGLGQGADLTVLLLPALLGPGSPLHDAARQAVADGLFGVVPDRLAYGGTSMAADLLCEISVSLHAGDIRDCLLVSAETRASPFVLDVMEAREQAPVRTARHTPLPGEIGVALYLCPVQGDAIARGQTLTQLITAQEPHAPEDPDRSLMGRASVPALRSLGTTPPGTRLLIDTDGPRHKAEEFGVILSAGITVEEADIVVPSASVGSVGCATLPLFLSTGLGLLFDAAPGVVGWVCSEAGERIVFRMA